MRVRHNNPEGDPEFLSPGDRLVFITDLAIISFKVPLEQGRVTQIIDAKEGDVVEYIGTTFKAREFSAVKSVPLYEFVFIPADEKGEILLDEYGDPITKIPFVIKNVETILKWTEPVDEFVTMPGNE